MEVWFSGKRCDLGMLGGGSKQAITMHNRKNALERMLEVEDGLTAPLENLDLVVDTFHKATIPALDKKLVTPSPMSAASSGRSRNTVTRFPEPVVASVRFSPALAAWSGSC